MDSKIYIKCDKCAQLNKKEVCLCDVATIWSADKKAVEKLKKLCLFTIGDEKRRKFSVSILYVLKLINEHMPNADIEILGEEDFVVDYSIKKNGKLLQILKLLFVAMIVFFGGAFAIMAYENDIDIKGVFENIYRLAGVKKEGFGVLEISYSLGIATGIIVFYNHFVGKKWNNDPTPVVVEMKKYETDINTALIDISKRNGEELKP
ncbi:MAG: stage V sporulation protein AA [Lachnospiraceae bacterium]|nr:stage V sporulation protein AA [Lachnospiraceae bacterium]